MTISTISSGIGLKTPAGNNASIDEKHPLVWRHSVDATTALAQSVAAPAIHQDSTAPQRRLSSPSEIPLTPVINGLGLGLKFSTDKETGTTVITVVDTESGAVVRQIPTEEVLNFMRQFEHGKGTLLSVKL